MNPLHALAQPAFASLASALVHFLWQGMLIALLLAACKRLFRIERAGQRYACSLAALVAMALCPVVTYFAIAPDWTQPRPVTAEAETIEFEMLADDGAAAPMWLDGWAQSAQPYFLALWLAGVLTLGLRLSVGMVGLSHMGRDRLPLPLELAARIERLGQRLRMDALPRVFVSRQVSEAIAAGFFRPVVLVPAAWVTEMPVDMLEGVIAHELAHLRRLDLWVNLLQRVVETLLFYHPAVWWVSRQLRQEREMCCDELAVGATGARLAYVQALELVARERVAGVRPALAAGIRGESNMKLLARVRNVLSGNRETAGSVWPAGLLALLLPLSMWAVTWGVLSPTPTAVAAQEREEEEGDRPRKDGQEREREVETRDEEGAERKEVRREGDRPRKEGERGDGDQPRKGPRDGEVRKEGPRDGESPRKGPRDGEQPRKEGARDGDAPVKKPIRKDGDQPRKEGPRDGEEVRKDPVKREIRKDPPEGDAPRKKIVREGDAPRKEGEGAAARLEALIKELRTENERLRAELRELRGDKPVKPTEKEASIDKSPAAAKEALIKKLADSADKSALEKKRLIAAEEGERAAIEKKRLIAAQEQERAAIEKKERIAAENEERAAVEKKLRAAAEKKEREAAERKERLRDEARARADKEEAK